MSPNPKKTKVISEAKEPTNLRELQSFMGLGNYYRRFVKNYAKIVEPLNKLRRSVSMLLIHFLTKSTVSTRLLRDPNISQPAQSVRLCY